MADRPAAVRLAVGVAVGLTSVALGGAACVAALGVHRSPLGLALAVATPLVALDALGRWTRPGPVGFAAGWTVVLLVAASGRGEGDYVVSSDGYGWALLLTGLAVVLAGVVSAARRGRPVGSPVDRDEPRSALVLRQPRIRG